MKTLRDALLAVIKRFIVAIISTLGVMVLFGFILEKMEVLVNTKLYAALGRGTVLFTAIIGTPLHETAHWLGCKLFGLEVHDVELLRPSKYKIDGILGYVQYSYNQDNLWQKLGCFFTGIAPMIMGVVFILLFTWILKPEIYTQIRERVDKATYGVKNPSFFAVCWAGFSGFWKGLFSFKKWGWFRGIIYLYIVMSTSMHMTISPADIEGAMAGIWIVLALYGIFAVITAMIGNDYIIPGAKTAALFSAFFSIGLTADAFLLGLSILFSGVGNFKGLNDIVDIHFMNTINLNKYVIVSEEGYDHYGDLTVEFNSEKFLKKYGKRINGKARGEIVDFINYFTPDDDSRDINELLSDVDVAAMLVDVLGVPKAEKTDYLSNGDVITLTWDSIFNNGLFDFDAYIEDLGFRINHKDFTYEINNLTEIENFNPFDGLTYSISGVDEAAVFELNTNSLETKNDVVFYPKSAVRLKNGDTVTVRAKVDDVNKYVEKHNKLPYPTEISYEVAGLPHYARSTDEMGNNKTKEKDDLAVQAAYSIAESWVEECKIESATCIGNIFLAHENSAYMTAHNKYISVVKVHVVSALEPNLDFEYYYPEEYINFLINEGVCDDGKESTSMNPNAFYKLGDFIGKDGNIYSKLRFIGYENLDELVDSYIDSFEGFDIVEKNFDF